MPCAVRRTPTPHAAEERRLGRLHAARFSTIEETPAVPVNRHVIPVATLVEVAVRIAPAAYLMPRTSVFVRCC